jgi:hypothetical protein
MEFESDPIRPDPESEERALPISESEERVLLTLPPEWEYSEQDKNRRQVSLELALARAARRERESRRVLVVGITLLVLGTLLSVLMLMRLALVPPRFIDIAFTMAVILVTVPAGIFLCIYSIALIRMLTEQEERLRQDLAFLQLRSETVQP